MNLHLKIEPFFLSPTPNFFFLEVFVATNQRICFIIYLKISTILRNNKKKLKIKIIKNKIKTIGRRHLNVKNSKSWLFKEWYTFQVSTFQECYLKPKWGYWLDQIYKKNAFLIIEFETARIRLLPKQHWLLPNKCDWDKVSILYIFMIKANFALAIDQSNWCLILHLTSTNIKIVFVFSI